MFSKGIGALDLEDYQGLAGQGWAEDIRIVIYYVKSSSKQEMV